MPAVSNEAMIRYCNAVYDLLESEAKDGVWEGGIMAKFSTLGISNAHYGKVMGTLYDIGSLEQVRRGARSNPTVIRLHRKPDADRIAAALSLTSRLTSDSPYATLTQRVDNLEGRLQGIDLAKYISTTERRLKALEAEVRRERNAP